MTIFSSRYRYRAQSPACAVPSDRIQRGRGCLRGSQQGAAGDGQPGLWRAAGRVLWSHWKGNHWSHQGEAEARGYKVQFGLSHLCRDKIATIMQTTISNSFSCMKIVVFWSRFHWYFFPTKHTIHNMPALAPIMACCLFGAEPLSGLVYPQYASLCPDELTIVALNVLRNHNTCLFLGMINVNEIWNNF